MPTTIADIHAAFAENGWTTEYKNDWRITVSIEREPTSMIRFECLTVKVMHMSHDNTFTVQAQRNRTVSRIGIWNSEVRNFERSFTNSESTVADVVSYCEELL